MELPDPEVCYRALQSRDARFDGLVFVGVKTTGIYCRPVCPARTPKLLNCRFFGSAAAAQDAGFRPCLRCRPETAPDMASWKGTSNTVSRALALIAEGALDGEGRSVERLAGRLGLGERQLRRLFLQHLGASPISVAQTRRVLFAKQLIHETRMPMTEVAMAAGFGSLRRFNETFLEMFRRPPSALRRKASGANEERDVTLRLRYRPPYDWEYMLAYLRMRLIAGIELIEGERYFRTVEVNGKLGSIEVSHLPERESLAVRIRFPDVRLLPAIVARVRRLFDLGADIGMIGDHLSADPTLAPLVARRPGLRAPGGWDGFETAVRAVLNQQISIAAAKKLAGQLVALHGRPVPKLFGIHPGLTHVFPMAKRLATVESIGLAMPAGRLMTLKAVAEAVETDPNLFRPFGDVDQTVARLREIRGIGEWTAQYIALRAVREMDAFSGDGCRAVAECEGDTGGVVEQGGVMAALASLCGAASLGRRYVGVGTGSELTKESVMSLAYKLMKSPVGELKLIASHKGLVAVLWENDPPHRVKIGEMVEDKRQPVLMKAERQLGEYFAGKRKDFSVPLDMRGTTFQRDVWRALLEIPFGETRSYLDLAKRLGNPNATRAVGAANGRNPLSIVVPCHRVIGSSGKLTGFAGGLEVKARLLGLEGSSSPELRF